MKKFFAQMILMGSHFNVTVRPRDTRPQAAQILTMHVFEWVQKNLRCTKLCSENLKLHGFLMSLPLPY